MKPAIGPHDLPVREEQLFYLHAAALAELPDQVFRGCSRSNQFQQDDAGCIRLLIIEFVQAKPGADDAAGLAKNPLDP
jgi:hypothetical protein